MDNNVEQMDVVSVLSNETNETVDNVGENNNNLAFDPCLVCGAKTKGLHFQVRKFRKRFLKNTIF